ncbi:DUF6177 family protein [Microlunatus sp. Gsoil 973]|uniref:DUF6177 family protein n=1 Tax=Microlunatus sp. Gsoil 973 TaxID=2672569 RepID=UPI0012B4EA0B|nr:DUF6177 family protein [Microlunatus sp. Gsoil 973]QGN34631.1 hypothetical protein GJV80_19375 [Microlunatus sp. Gsoil 973]
MADPDEPVPLTTEDVAHPLADRLGQAADGTRWVATETRSRVVHLSAGRMNLLAIAARDGRRPVLISDELSSLTPACARIWQQSGGSWVVRQSGGGLRNGFGGRRIDRIEEAWTQPRPRTVDDYAVGYLRPTDADILQITTIVGLRHPAREQTLLGGPVEQLNDAASDGAAMAWGATEPVGEPWNRRRLTDAIRTEMPRLTTVIATGRNLSATLAAQRTNLGVEEIDHVLVGIGSPAEEALARIRTRMADVLRRLAETGMPLVGMQLARRGPRDLSVPPSLLPPPVPLSLFLGAPAVRGFGLDVAQLRERFGAEPVGRPRLPALLFDLGQVGFEAWQRLDRILGSLNPDLLAESLGMGAASLSEVRAGAPLPDPEGGSDA